MYYRVAPFSRSFDTYGLIYRIPDTLQAQIQPGMIVEIPLKTGKEKALLLDEVLLSSDMFPEQVKDIHTIVEQELILENIQRALIVFISQYYITPIHHAVNLFFPRNLLERIEKQTLSRYKPKKYDYTCIWLELSEAQSHIFQNIRRNPHKKHLIYGVTGSGKTQIYMKCIEENLRVWKQTLLLIPEIILTSQIGERVKEVFWNEVILLHSGVSQAKKTQYWLDIKNWHAKIIIGTRSSLFYPYQNLKTIIIDEEHDASYVSDSAPRYHAREVAEKLSELWDIELILGSGTPKVETFYRALQGEFTLHQLLEKYQ